MKKISLNLLRNIILILVLLEFIVIIITLFFTYKKVENIPIKEYQKNITNSTSLLSIYETALIGDYSSQEGYTFAFKKNNIFNGYYDNQNTNVMNYNYVVTSINERIQIVINPPDDNISIKYNLSFDKNGNAILTNAETLNTFILKMDN